MLRMRSSCRVTTVARPYCLTIPSPARDRAVADGAVDIEALLAALASVAGVTSHRNAGAPVRAHFAGVPVIRPCAETKRRGRIRAGSACGAGARAGLRARAAASRSRSAPCPSTGMRDRRDHQQRNPSGAWAALSAVAPCPGKSRSASRSLVWPRKPRNATIAIADQQEDEEESRAAYQSSCTTVSAGRPFLRAAGVASVLGKSRIARFDHEEEPVVRRPAEPLPVEHRMIPARQSVHDQHGEERGEGREENRQLKHDGEERRHCPPVDRLSVHNQGINEPRWPEGQRHAVSKPVMPPIRTGALSHDLPRPIASSMP